MASDFLGPIEKLGEARRLRQFYLSLTSAHFSLPSPTKPTERNQRNQQTNSAAPIPRGQIMPGQLVCRPHRRCLRGISRADQQRAQREEAATAFAASFNDEGYDPACGLTLEQWRLETFGPAHAQTTFERQAQPPPPPRGHCRRFCRRFSDRGLPECPSPCSWRR